MIIGLGIDVIKHSRIEELGWLEDSELQKRIFSEKELTSLPDQSPIRFMAGRFACKEAVLKCLKTGMVDGISLNEISTLKDLVGYPKILLTGEVAKMADSLGIKKWHVSITHSENTSLGMVIAEG